MAGRIARGGALLALAGLVAALGGCGVRMETPDPVWPSPDAVTQQRDALAEASALVIAAADAEGGDDTAVVSGVAAVHLEALGGVYVAYPDATPGPDESSPSASPAPVPSLETAVADARALAVQVADTSTDASLAQLAAAMDLGYALTLAWLERAGGAGGAEPSAEPSATPSPGDAAADATAPAWASSAWPVAVPEVPEATAVPEATLGELAVAFDQARYALQAIAGIEAEPLRSRALALAEQYRDASDAYAAPLGADPREAVYQLGGAEVADADARAAVLAELDATVAELAVVAAAQAAPEDRAWLTDAAVAASLRAWAQQAEPVAPVALPSVVIG